MKETHRLRNRHRTVAFEVIVERTVLEILHHIVRRFGVPTDIQQLHDVAIRGEKDELLDFSRQQRPVQRVAVREKLNRHMPAGGLIQRYPDLPVSAFAQESARLVTRNLGRWRRRFLAEITRMALLVVGLGMRLLEAHLSCRPWTLRGAEFRPPRAAKRAAESLVVFYNAVERIVSE